MVLRCYVEFMYSIDVVLHPDVAASCERLNNCSGQGNCSVLNLCVCEDGFYGVNCSLGKY